MKIDWLYLAVVVMVIMLGISSMYENKNDNETKQKQIEYCIEMKIQNCPEVK